MAAVTHRIVLTSDQIQVRDHRDHNYHRSSQSIPDDDMNSLEDSDSMESCFVGTEEEFYSSTLTPPTPSEDIWKKFELYPTPPLSPSHNPDDKVKDCDRHPRHHPQDGEADLLQEVTNILMDDDDLPWLTRKCHFSDPAFRAPSPISPALIQDCMWSSIIAEERRKLFMKSEKKHTEERANKKASSLHSGAMLPPLVPASEYGSSDCVDPSAVFPYPLSETRLDLFSSGTNTPSDSEEEIDVVTVEKKHSVHKTNSTRPYHKQSSTKVRHHHRPISVTLVGSKRGRPSTATILSIPIKKLKTEGNLEEVKQILQKSNLIRSSSGSSRGSSRGCSRNSSRPSSQPSSHPSSDSEDTEKRACHNVLERKRREDLRTSFLLLRDEVPELGTCDRAAKVVILKKATDYVSSLRDREETLRMDMATEKDRNIQLRRRLEALLAPLPL